MTKEEIIELQEKTARLRRLFWDLLIRGQFPSEEHAKAVFNCYFALDKVAGLVTQYIAQLPLEEPPVTQGQMADLALELLPHSNTPPLVNSPIAGTRLSRRRGTK